MPTPLSTMLRAATRRPDEPLNILTFPTHERYESNMCRTGHNFFSFRAPGVKDWNTTYAPVPSNYTLLNPKEGDAQIPPGLVIDVVLSQNKFGQFDIAKRIANRLNIPLVSLEHTLPHPGWGNGPKVKLKQQRGDINIFISEHSMQEWGWGQGEGRVIHHGIDTELFSPDNSIHRKPQCLSVVNDWINRDWCCGFHFWKKATEGLPCFVVGDTPHLSKPAASLEELVWRYQQSAIFVNTATVSPIPTVLLEAMACGCAIVSTRNPMIEDVIQHSVNGYMADTPEDMKYVLGNLLGNEDECRRLGEAARETILTKFPLPLFVDAWDATFEDATKIVLHGD